MKALENRTLDSKREMDILNALDDMRSLKALHGKVRHTIVEDCAELPLFYPFIDCSHSVSCVIKECFVRRLACV